MIVCTRMLTVGRASRVPEAVLRERMRLSRRDFDRGLVGDFRPVRNGGRRRLLPLVSVARKVLVGRPERSRLREVDAIPVWRVLHPEEHYSAEAWWGLPAWLIEDYVRDALQRGAYREAGLWSAALSR